MKQQLHICTSLLSKIQPRNFIKKVKIGDSQADNVN